MVSTLKNPGKILRYNLIKTVGLEFPFNVIFNFQIFMIDIQLWSLYSKNKEFIGWKFHPRTYFIAWVEEILVINLFNALNHRYKCSYLKLSTSKFSYFHREHRDFCLFFFKEKNLTCETQFLNLFNIENPKVKSQCWIFSYPQKILSRAEFTNEYFAVNNQHWIKKFKG